MALRASKEDLAQIRRDRAQAPYVAPEIIAIAASRTPDITRFKNAAQRRREQVQNETSSATAPSRYRIAQTAGRASRGIRVSVVPLPRDNEIKTHFATSRILGDKNRVETVPSINTSLPYTPVTSRTEFRRSSRKTRPDIYDLEDEANSTEELSRDASAFVNKQLDHTFKEPSTRSFRYSDEPSSPRNQESQTIEQCVKVARKVPQAVRDEVNQELSPELSRLTARDTVAKAAIVESNQQWVSRYALSLHGYLEWGPAPENKYWLLTEYLHRDEQLTDLDREILQLGDEDQLLSSIEGSSNPKRDNYNDLGHFANDADGESDAPSDEPSLKRQRRSGRQNPAVASRNTALQELTHRRTTRTYSKSARAQVKPPKAHRKSQKPKKKRRKLPVNELVTVSERLGNSDVEVATSRQAELSQDPISQQDEQESDESEGEHYKPDIQVKINFRPRNRVGAIDISLFRMPKRRNASIMERTPQHLVQSCSDGFEGKEATPTGLYMPVKRHSRRRESHQKITIRLGELTLVPERREEVQVEPTSPTRIKKRRRRAEIPNARDHGLPDPVHNHQEHHLLNSNKNEHGQDHMLVDDQEEAIEAEHGPPQEHYRTPVPLLQERLTSVITSNGDAVETPTYLVSPLKRKQFVTHNAKTGTRNSRREGILVAQGTQQSVRGPNGSRIGHQVTMISGENKTPLRVRNDSLRVAQELMMVSAQRNPNFRYDTDNSDGDSEVNERESAESYSGSESENEDDENSVEEEEELTPEEETEQEEDNDNEGGSQQEEIAAKDGEFLDFLQDLARNDSQAPKEMPATSVTSDAAASVGKDQNLPLSEKESQGTPHEDFLESRMALKKMASQALEQLLSSPPKISAADISISVSRRQDVHGNREDINDSRGRHNQSHSVSRRLSDNASSSWRPRVPVASGLVMEVDEDIVDSPTPTPTQARQRVRRPSSRRPSGFGSQLLTMVQHRHNSPLAEQYDPTSLQDTQGSIELGSAGRGLQGNLLEPVHETQTSNQPEIPETQFSAVLQMDYLQRALSNLSGPIRRPIFSRTNSLPAHALFAQQGTDADTMMAGGITMTNAFQHTVSPVKSGRRMPSLLEESPGTNSLKALTRKASLNMGTVPSLPPTPRNRTPLLLMRPPFLERSTL